MPLNQAGRNALLNTGKGGFTHISAITDINAAPTEATGVTRQAVTWGTATTGVATNTGALTIPVGAGNTVVGIALYDALSAGNALGIFPVGSSGQYVDGFASAATTGTFTSIAHGLTTDDRVFFSAVAGESLPATLSATTIYFVRATGLTADSFTIATTSGGAAVTFTTGGEVAFFKTVPNTFASAGNLTIAIGSLTLDATFA